MASLKQVISLSEDNSKPLLVPPTLFYRYDKHQQAKRQLYHLLRGALLGRQLRARRKHKHFMKLRPQIVDLLDRLSALYHHSERCKSIAKFKMLLNGLNQNQAAIKIQKVWRGFRAWQEYRNVRAKMSITASPYRDSKARILEQSDYLLQKSSEARSENNVKWTSIL